MLIRLLFVCALTSITACGAPPADDTHGVTTDPNAAIGFFTENTPPPDTARDVRGDGVMRDADERPYGYTLLGQKLPEIEAPRLDGSTFRSAGIDQWTVIKVWGIWCGDCRRDSPYVAELANAIASDPDLNFHSIHTPPSARRVDEAYGDYGSVEAYFEEQGYSFPVAVDADASIRDALGIAWTPSYLLVDASRRVRGFRTDLSVAGSDSVDVFLHDIAEVRAEVENAAPVTPTIGADNAMLLNGPTAFTRPALAAAFPGLDIHGGTQMSEGEEYPVFHVIADGGAPSNSLLFTIEPTWERGHVFAVTTQSSLVSGPEGVQIGESVLSDLPKRNINAPCEPGVDTYADKLLCIQDGARGQLAFVFEAPGGYDGYSPGTVTEAQSGGDLVEMRYLPPLPGD
ncbi:MAG: TlpA disulfide reductase family protein [Pseudomonadota bacterium]